VTPTEIEQAVSRTSAQYMGDLRTMLAEVGKVYESQLLAKDQTITTQADMLALQTETIAELRRRAEVAEAEVLRQRQEQEATQAAPAGAWAQEAPMLAQEHTAGAWGRLRRWWGS
jgi:multidrug efflux pump subunit AcrA (membrane-fusion protein)